MNNRLEQLLYYQSKLNDISFDCMVARHHGDNEKLEELRKQGSQTLKLAESRGFKAIPELSDLELPRYILE